MIIAYYNYIIIYIYTNSWSITGAPPPTLSFVFKSCELHILLQQKMICQLILFALFVPMISGCVEHELFVSRVISFSSQYTTDRYVWNCIIMTTVNYYSLVGQLIKLLDHQMFTHSMETLLMPGHLRVQIVWNLLR